MKGSDRLFRLDQQRLYEDLSRSNLVTSKRWYWITAVLALIVLEGVGAFIYMMATGIGVTGLNRPVMWGVMITLFVFWVGLSHSGTLISAILRITKTTWRAPVLRGAEAMTVLALFVGGLYPIIHLGRNWRFYYILPYPSERQLWPNFRSPLLWDAIAIFTYLTGSILFLYFGMIPDLAEARDRSQGWRKRLYTFLAMGFRGTHHEWERYHVASTIFAVLIIPVAVSVHSIVSWDFAMALVPGWHSTIFAPYFVTGAIYSGIAGVISVMTVLRKAYGLERVLTDEHFDNLGKFLLTFTLTWGYFYFSDFLTTWYSRLPEDWQVIRSYFGHYFPLFATMVTCNFLIPFPLLCLKQVRRSIPALFAVSVIVNIGMFAERLLIIIPSLARRNDPSVWQNYFPTWVEISYITASVALFALIYMLFSKLLPIVAVTDIKEQLFHTTDRAIGKVTLPAVVRGEPAKEGEEP
jgi:molybdopterin-containing oxidoreductase family membrane subunit